MWLPAKLLCVCLCFSLNDWFFFLSWNTKKNKNNNRLSINTWWMDWLIDWFNEWIIWTFFFVVVVLFRFNFQSIICEISNVHTHTHIIIIQIHWNCLHKRKIDPSFCFFEISLKFFWRKKKSSHMMMMMMMKNKYSKMEIENEKKNYASNCVWWMVKNNKFVEEKKKFFFMFQEQKKIYFWCEYLHMWYIYLYF